MTDLTVLSADSRTDATWWRQAVVYQVYPRSFADSDGDGLGDIPGVTSKIPYLAGLGVDAIWLSPFYPSALADGGYDVADYRDVHPQLGTLADFDDLMTAAHGAGIKVIVDIVPNHTSDLHPWFVEALASPPGSPARERYIFRDGKGPDGSRPPSDWISHFGGSAWTRVPDGQWYCHLFAPEQPDLNWDNREVRDDFLVTLRFWADRGVDGFRVDVAHALAKDLSEPLRSKPTLEDHPSMPIDGTDPLYDRDEVHEIYRRVAAGLRLLRPAPHRGRRGVRTVGAARPLRPADGARAGLQLRLAGRPTTTPRSFRDAIAFCLSQAAASGSSSTWVLSNHDVVRHATRYALPSGTDLDEWLMSDGSLPRADEEAGLRRARAATALMLALPGSSYFYQGEELGLHEVADLPAERAAGPDLAADPEREEGPGRLPRPAALAPRGERVRLQHRPRLAAAAGRLLPDRGRRAGGTVGHHAGVLPRGPAGTAPAADHRGPDLGRDRRPAGAPLHPPRRLALPEQLRPDRGPAARRRGPAVQWSAPGRRPAAGDHRLADRVAAPRLRARARGGGRPRTVRPWST